jgi:hypothetical protein
LKREGPEAFLLEEAQNGALGVAQVQAPEPGKSARSRSSVSASSTGLS